MTIDLDTSELFELGEQCRKDLKLDKIGDVLLIEFLGWLNLRLKGGKNA